MSRQRNSTRHPFRRKRKRLQFEVLERRHLLANISWNLDQDGFWDVPGNWLDEFGVQRVPTADDDVTVDRAGSNFTITIRTDDQSVRSLQNHETLVVTGGSLTVAASSQLAGEFSLEGGSLIVNGPLTLAGTSSWKAGTITGSATLTNSGTLNYSAAGINSLGNGFNNTGSLVVLSGTLSLVGTVSQVTGTTLTGGSWHVANGATLDLASAANLATNEGTVILDGATSAFPKINTLTTNTGNISILNGRNFSVTGNLLNRGKFTVGTGTLELNNHAVDNETGGLFDLKNDVAMSGASQVTNAGTFRKSGGAGNLTIHPFTNIEGTIDVRSGTLALDGAPLFDSVGATWTGGDFQVAAGAVLDWIGTNAFQRFDLTGNYTGSGGGIVRHGGGTMSIGSAGATFDFSPGIFRWGSALGTAMDGGLVGLTNVGTITLEGAGAKSLLGKLDNSGTIVHRGTGDLDIRLGANLSILDDAHYDLQGDGSVLGQGEARNRGTIHKSAGGGTSGIGTTTFVNDDGAIDVQTGVVQIGRPFFGSSQGIGTGGQFTVAAGAVLDLVAAGSTITYGGVYTGSGQGTVRVSSNSGHLQVGPSGATFNFPAGMFQWTGGTLDAGTVGLNNTGFVNLTGASTKFLSGVLNNAGTMTHAGAGNLEFFNGTLNNLVGGVYDLQGDLNFTRSAITDTVFNNSGTLRKSAGAGFSANTFGVDFNNLGGTINVQSGVFSMSGSPTTVHTGGTFLVALGGVLDLTGGDRLVSTVFRGNYTGAGEGIVQLTGGTVAAGNTGAVFNFPPGMFQWFGGVLDGRTAPVTNRGQITLPDIGLQPVVDGALHNSGTITMIGEANLLIRGSGGTGVVTNQASGLFEFLGDDGLVRPQAGSGVGSTFINQGTLRKSGAAGLATISSHIFSNTGTLATEAGTMRIESGTLAQVSGNTLTAGKWQALAGGSIDLVNAPALTDNNAEVILQGVGSRFAKLDSLTDNLGALSLLDNRDFATTGPLHNAGSLVVGAGSTLAVTGNYTQSDDATLSVQLGGDPGSELFGRLISTETAALNGTFNVSLVGGFGPAAGQSFPVMEFPSHTGDFSEYTGLRMGRFPLFSTDLSTTNLHLTSVTSTADLAFGSFQSATFPASAIVGQDVTMSYSVQNLADLPAVGDWIDSVYLSRDGHLDPTDTLLARVEHHGGVAGMGSYSETVTAPLPPLAEGSYRVLVLADSRGLASDADRGNNLGISPGAIATTVPSLPIGTPVSGSIEPGKSRYFRLLVAPGEDLTLTADFASSPGADVFVRYGALPDGTSFNDSSPAGHLHPQLLLTNAQGGIYYVQLRGKDDAVGNVAFTLEANASDFEITRVSPLRGSNAGPAAIVDIRGSQFTHQTEVRLRSPTGELRAASSVKFVNANRIVATIDLSGLPVDDYQITLDQAGQTTTAYDTFRVTSNPPGETRVFMWPKVFQMPSSSINNAGLRTGGAFRLAIGEYNTSDSPLPAPLYFIRATNVQPGENLKGSFVSDAIPPRTLPGGYYNDDVRTIKFKPAVVGDHVKSKFELFAIEPTQTSMEWDARKSDLRPSTIPPDAWDAVWENLRPRLGDTLSDFWQLLIEDSEKLAEVGESVVEIDRLFSFEMQKANNAPAVPVPANAVDVAFPAPGLPFVFGRDFGETIIGRYHLGRLGRGWTDNFDISIREDLDTGLVTVSQGGQARFFSRQDDASYLGTPGEFATLGKVNNAFQLRETTGAMTSFRNDGLWDFLEDSNSNRITAGYSGSLLTSLNHTNGTALNLTYTGSRLHQITDPAGGVATYEYDASGQRLIRVTTTAGMTEYTYTADPDGPGAHALESITFRDGTHRFFEYDSQGRLARQQGDGGAEAVRYAYDVASFSVTDATNQVTTFLYDDSFRMRRAVDPLGRASDINYDASNHPVVIAAGGGGNVDLAYDPRGNPTVVQNPLGETTVFTYEPDRARLVNAQDALGRDTRFSHDSAGNLLTKTFPDGSTERYTYDTQGNVQTAIDRLGQITRFTYNSRGQYTRKELSDGTRVDYSYDARGNLQTIVDASGTTQLEYLDPQNSALLTRISYPSGRFLEYSYQNGRRIGMVDQSGFAVSYQYDAVGRLDLLRDGGGSLIVDYDYDSVGRLARESRGNGTVTEYTYDLGGEIATVQHRVAGGAIQSQLEYTYDHLGRRTSVTADGSITNYDYDGAGRLTTVSLPTGRRISYSYDAAGNRVTSQDSGDTVTYALNELNEYVTIGTTTQTFDAAGNLVSSADPAGNTSFYYDLEGRLVKQITPNGTWTYEYNALGSRVASTHDGVRTEYLVDPTGLGNVVGEYDGSGNLQAHYIHGIGLTSRVAASGPAAYYQFDAGGNTTQLTGNSGFVLNSYSYLPFGEALSKNESIGNAFEYAGRFGVMREGSGIDYMRNRWFDPEQGRFTQPDPIGLMGGTNLYAYVGNDPLRRVDPSGLNPILAAAEVVLPFGELAAGGLSGEAAALEAGFFTFSGAQQAVDILGAESAALHGYAVITPAATAPAVAAAPAIPAEVSLVGEAGLAIVIALDLASVFLVSQALIQKEASLLGGEVGCTPVIPVSLQVCNPQIDFLTGKHLQTLEMEQMNPAEDPNDIVGRAGFGDEGFFSPSPLSYRINFQNKPEALGPAAEVVVNHVLDPDLDLDTLELGDFGFGDFVVEVPEGRQLYQIRIDLLATRGVLLDVTARLDRSTRTVSWTFQSLDAETMDLTGDPTAGFLPPDRTAPEGQGYVSFFAHPRLDLPTGTRIDAQARIIFDTNAPLDTNVWINTLDVGPPASRVDPLPAVTNLANFPVNWSGTDDFDGKTGSGIATFDIFVSDNSGPFVLWLDDTAEYSAMYPGQSDHTYRFYSVATDNVSHEHSTPGISQAEITVDTTLPVLANMPADRTIEATMPSGAIATFTVPTASDNLDPNPIVDCNRVSGSAFALGTTTVLCTATDAAGNIGQASFRVTVLDSTPPTVTVPGNMAVEATGSNGAPVDFISTAADVVDGALTTTCEPASGSTFPLATTVVTCRATDAHGNTGSASFRVTVEASSGGNTAPLITSLTSSNPSLENAGSVRSPVSIRGTLADVDVADSHRITIDWGDGTEPQTIDAVENDPLTTASFVLNHLYARGGVFTIQVSVDDRHGGTAVTTAMAVVRGVGLVDDTLYVIGSEKRDHLQIKQVNSSGSKDKSSKGGARQSMIRVQVFGGIDDWCVGNEYDFVLNQVTKILVLVGGGNDQVIINKNLSIETYIDGGRGNDYLHGGSGRDIIDGGDGNDRLHGGRGDDLLHGGAGRDALEGSDGHDILLGDAGDDSLTGSDGRDLLIGGIGADRLTGNTNDDILIAGFTAYDNTNNALRTILEEWSGNGSYRTRVANLEAGVGTSGVHLSGNDGIHQTVFNDDDVDKLTGNQGLDWWLANLVKDGGVLDVVTDRAANEIWNDIDF